MSFSTEGCIEKNEMLCSLELVYKMHTVDNSSSPQSTEANLYKEVAELVYKVQNWKPKA